MHILPNARVLKVNTNSTDGQHTATGIQYSMSGADLTGRTITANKEVILTGGAVGSPHMLMMSGIGPKANLESVGVQSVVDLPGVGQHVTDHVASEVIFKTTAATAATDRVNQSLTDGAESFFSFVNSAIAYANITDLFGDYAPEFRDTIARNLTWAVENVCPSDDPTIQAGYRAVHEANTENFILSPIGHVELLLGLTGTAQGGDDSIAIQAALQHPFSSGQIYLNSSNPWEYPVIDPNYLAHPADTWLIREGLKLARKIGNTAPLSNFMTSEVFPGTTVQTDAEWDAWLATQVKTEYHPSSSCSMMPLDHGGVVGADLKVHGFTNLRVADSSVFPVQFAAHLQSLTYGVGEIASDMIKNVSRSVTDSNQFRASRLTPLFGLFLGAHGRPSRHGQQHHLGRWFYCHRPARAYREWICPYHRCYWQQQQQPEQRLVHQGVCRWCPGRFRPGSCGSCLRIPFRCLAATCLVMDVDRFFITPAIRIHAFSSRAHYAIVIPLDVVRGQGRER